MIGYNLILDGDSYKSGHAALYNPAAKHIYTYFESRGGDFRQTLFFGPQAYFKAYLSQPVTHDHIDEAEQEFAHDGEPFNRPGWERIVDVHGGYLPLRIKAAPEGLVMPTSNVMMTVENLDPELLWLGNYLDSPMLRAIWYPTTVATLDWHIKQDIKAALEKTSDDPAAVLPYMSNDFGARGASSRESAGLGGMGHLVNFRGSDNLEAARMVRRFYQEPHARDSIAATEHSVMTSYGLNGEEQACEMVLDVYLKPGKMAACVSDTYDLVNCVENIWGKKFRNRIIESGARLVIRPDSGNPVEIVRYTVKALAERFGYTINGKGYKLLVPCVRVIQGDGINRESINDIMNMLIAEGFAVENAVFGMGGALLQKVDRDTLRFAAKASAIRTDIGWHGIRKTPKTDMGKQSKQGRLKLIKVDGNIVTVGYDDPGEDLLVTVWEAGNLLKDWTFAEIQARSNEPYRLAA